MQIDVFTFCFNEELILPHFLKHYSAFSNNITVFDNMSNDNSRAIIKSFPNTAIIDVDTGGTIDNQDRINIKNECWKNSKADWIIIVDVDEFLYHPLYKTNIPAFFNLCDKQDISIVQTKGFNMISRDGVPPPDKSIFDIKEGVSHVWYNKPAAFNPKIIKETNFTVGQHGAAPLTKNNHPLYLSAFELYLLHYKYLSVDYVRRKHQRNFKRLTKHNIENNWSWHYFPEYNENLEDDFEQMFSERRLII